jgi:hypothetical protein
MFHDPPPAEPRPPHRRVPVARCPRPAPAARFCAGAPVDAVSWRCGACSQTYHHRRARSFVPYYEHMYEGAY